MNPQDFSAFLQPPQGAPVGAPMAPVAQPPQQQQFAPQAPPQYQQPPQQFAQPTYQQPPQAPPQQQYAPQAPQQFAQPTFQQPPQAPPQYAPQAPPQYQQPPQQFAQPQQWPQQQPQQPQVQLDPTQVLAGLEHAQAQSENGAYFKEGQYVVRLEGMKCFMSARGKGPMVVAEFTILASTNPENPVGTRASQTIKANGSKYSLEDIRNLIVALAGLDEKEDAQRIATQLMPQIMNVVANAIKTGALNGRTANLRAWVKTSPPTAQRPQGGQFTKHTYSRVVA